jgi:hypothetical protein
LSLVIDRLQLEIAFLLGAASKLANSICNVGQAISVKHALQFVDMLEKFPSVLCVCVSSFIWG